MFLFWGAGVQGKTTYTPPTLHSPTPTPTPKKNAYMNRCILHHSLVIWFQLFPWTSRLTLILVRSAVDIIKWKWKCCHAGCGCLLGVNWLAVWHRGLLTKLFESSYKELAKSESTYEESFPTFAWNWSELNCFNSFLKIEKSTDSFDFSRNFK